MRTARPEGDTHSFVIRIWYETHRGQAGEPAWRGSVDYVPSGERLYFCDLATCIRFIQEQARLATSEQEAQAPIGLDGDGTD
jgi:hypothetical protein